MTTRDSRYSGIWSAAPTPLTRTMQIDSVAVRRMIDHHWRLGVKGLFLAGTNGEGPWLTRGQKVQLVRDVVSANRGRMLVSAQVTENSAPQILENIELVKMAGADIAVMAPPFFLFNATPANILKLYRDVIRRSVLPIGIYDRGLSGAVVVPDDVLAAIYLEPRVVLIKDSSNNTGRRDIALAARARRPVLSLLTGYEFDCVSYLQSGYDGALLGGGVFNAYIANMIYAAMRDGNLPAAQRLQAVMNRLMWEVYGGKQIACWLAGEKYLLTRMGIFRTWRNHLNYEVTPACRRAIGRALVRDRDLLLPGRTRGHA